MHVNVLRVFISLGGIINIICAIQWFLIQTRAQVCVFFLLHLFPITYWHWLVKFGYRVAWPLFYHPPGIWIPSEWALCITCTHNVLSSSEHDSIYMKVIEVYFGHDTSFHLFHLLLSLNPRTGSMFSKITWRMCTTWASSYSGTRWSAMAAFETTFDRPYWTWSHVRGRERLWTGMQEYSFNVDGVPVGLEQLDLELGHLIGQFVISQQIVFCLQFD